MAEDGTVRLKKEGQKCARINFMYSLNLLLKTKVQIEATTGLDDSSLMAVVMLRWKWNGSTRWDQGEDGGVQRTVTLTRRTLVTVTGAEQPMLVVQ